LKIKALFAFISKTEVTRGARRWSLDETKAEAPVLLRQALEGLKIKALFTFISKTEVTRGARRWSLDETKAEAPVQRHLSLDEVDIPHPRIVFLDGVFFMPCERST